MVVTWSMLEVKWSLSSSFVGAGSGVVVVTWSMLVVGLSSLSLFVDAVVGMEWSLLCGQSGGGVVIVIVVC